MKNLTQNLIAVSAALFLIISPQLHACACSFCSGYDVGTSSNFPSGKGGMLWTEYDFVSQSQNWSGTHSSAADNNEHKLIQSSWLSGGFQYFFNNSWGISAVVPYANRIVTAEEDHGPITTKWWGLGDIRVNGYYTGFSPDMSTGVNLGIKVPSGDWHKSGIDRDNQIGTGSTDILAGLYHRHRITSDEKWVWFAQAQLDAPVITQAGYRPGLQVSATAGIYYTGIRFGKLKIRPLAQALFTNRASDSGPESDPDNTGYQQVSLSPGLEFDFHPVRVYSDVELPVISNVVGNQLIAPCMVRVIVSYLF
ncbi:hypothetical protein EBU02_02225 [bacterium]|nr:hypothetical protein [bacterium]